MMKITDGRFDTKRGVSLFSRIYEPVDREPKAVILFIHGFCDYLSGTEDDCPVPTYHARAKRWTAWGAVCAGVEMEGHGRTAGTRAYVKDLNLFVDDTQEFLENALCTRWPKLPVFLFGESMGGAMAVLMSMRPNLSPQVKGMVLFAPMVMIHPSMMPPPLVVKVLRKLAKKKPKAKLVPGDSTKLAQKCLRDPELLKRLMEDDMIYKKRQRIGTAVAMLDATLFIDANMEKVTMPMLVLHGEADTVTEPSCSATLVKRASSADKTLKTYEGMWHALLSEEEWADMIYPDLFDWVSTRLSPEVGC